MTSAFGPGSFRLALAGLVVVSHFSRLEIGRVAVVAFFILSGYWVTLMFARKYADGATINFYLSRVLRIFPVYLVTLALAMFADHLAGEPRALTFSNVLLANLANVPFDEVTLRPAWSLDIELQFYLLVPLIVLVLGRTPRAMAAWSLVAAATVATIAAWAIGPDRIGFSVLSYAAPFAIGAAAALNPVAIRGRTALASIVLFGLIGAALLGVPVLRWAILKTAADPFDPLDRDVVAILWGMALVPFILWNVRLRSGSYDRVFGELAYTLYLGHWIVVRHYAQAFASLAPLVKLAAVGGSIAAITLFLYFAVDRPMERFRRKWFVPVAKRV